MGYLEEKAAELNSKAKDGRTDWTSAQVSSAFSDAGLTPETHYAQFGASEGLSNPTIKPAASYSNAANTYIAPQENASTFNENTYLSNKVAQLNQNAQDGRTDWTNEQVSQAMVKGGMTPQQHFEQFGKSENINPYQGKQFTKPILSTGLSNNETAEGRLNNMLQSDSPLMRTAETYGLQTANKRGLLDSSLAGQAAQSAMIESASPIAMQDAGAMQTQKQSILSGGIASDLSAQEAVQSQNLQTQSLTLQNDFATTLQSNGYDNDNATAMANMIASQTNTMMSGIFSLLNNTDIEMTDNVAEWASQYMEASWDSAASMFGLNIEVV